MTGNHHVSPKAYLRAVLARARAMLRDGRVTVARALLHSYRVHYDLTPASTRRRWKCGR